MNTAYSRLVIRSSRGFSLVEVLVGVVIGLIGIIVMFQVQSVWDKQKRTTASGSDAQMAGTVAMYKLERDIKQSGMGFGMAPGTAAQAAALIPAAAAPIMGCSVSAYYAGPPARAFAFSMYPVRIISGVGGAADTITTLYGDSSYFVSMQSFTATTASSKKTVSRNGFQRGDAVIVTGNNPTSCALVEVTNDTNADTLTFDHQSGSYTNFYSNVSATSRFNTAAGTGATFTSAGYLFNLGPTPQLNRWTIENDMLVRYDDLYTSTKIEVGENIVNLKALYGIDANADGRVADDGTTTFCTATNEWCDVAPTDWSKLLAVRVALLARSQQYEKSIVTPDAATAVDGVDRTPTYFSGLKFTMFNSADGLNWQQYRYRVYERIIPMRNMIWGTLP